MRNLNLQPGDYDEIFLVREKCVKIAHVVRLVILNDDSTPEKVTSNYDTLINKDHVNLIFGPFSTLLTRAAAKGAEKANPVYALVEGEGYLRLPFSADPYRKFRSLSYPIVPFSGKSE